MRGGPPEAEEYTYIKHYKARSFCYYVSENAAKYRVIKRPPNLNPDFITLHCVRRSELFSLWIKEYLLTVNTSAKNHKVSLSDI